MKKLYTIITILFAINLSFTQTDLYVSTNSYVFVDGDGFASGTTVAPLYVTNGIQLAANNSYIYLRDEAQLLQGNNVGNSGIGKLSAYQNGTVHNWAYNYWCSPVGNTDTSNNANRAFRANNNIYDVTSAPITSALATYTTGYDGTSAPLTISSRWLYTYNAGGSYPEWDPIAETGAAASGYGFIMKGTSGSGNNQLYDFRGKPNNGTMTTGVLAPISGIAQWTLVGNPYPSALDARDYIWNATNQANITGTLYFWEQDLSVNSHYVADYVGGYASYTINSAGTMETFVPATFDTYNSDGTLNTSGSSSTSGKAVKRYIPIGQGFMIEGVVNGNAIVTNSMREFYKQSGTNSEFFRSEDSNSNESQSDLNEIQYSEDGLAIIGEDFKRFRINVDFNELYTRQMVQTFHQSATEGFDYGLESKTPEPLTNDAYWVLDNVPYVAQAFTFDEALKIPLIVNVTETQPIRFRIFDIQNFDTSQPIYLHDIDADLYVDLRQQNYDINLEIGNYTNRFEITFNNETLSVTEIEDEDFKVFQNNSLQQLTILNPNGLDIKNISLIDVSGKQIFSNPINGNNSEYNYSTTSLSVGVYITSITLKDAKQISKKVIITD